MVKDGDFRKDQCCRRALRRVGVVAGILILGLAVLTLAVPRSLWDWRLDRARTYLLGVLHPVEEIPAPASGSSSQGGFFILPTSFPTRETDQGNSISTPVHIYHAELPPPEFDLQNDFQDWNNCGPATLALALRMYGWKGDQYTVAEKIKPERADRNVNIEELARFVEQNAPGLDAVYRVGGTLPLLKSFLAAGYPVIVEKSFRISESYWPGDDRWAGHYLLLTGYDDATQTFTSQDAYSGPNRPVRYVNLEADWFAFNNVYLVLFPEDKPQMAEILLGSDQDETLNRQNAIRRLTAMQTVRKEDPFLWFNLGSNLTYLEQYQEAARMFDRARSLGLPQRMLRYQFTPFMAYYQQGDWKTLASLIAYALERTPNSEEVLLWKARLLFSQKKKAEAISLTKQALKYNSSFEEARAALTYFSTP